MQRRLDIAAIVLAAGAGSRYSDEPGAKLLVTLDGRPLLANVLEAIRRFGPTVTAVVLGHGAEAVEAAIDWRGELRVRNHEPDRGLASSLQVGIDTLRAYPGNLDGAFIVLGDQPRLRPDALEALESAAAAARPADRPAVVPRYADDAGPINPVLLLRPAWTWVDELSGDHGLAPLIAQRPDMVLSVPVSGTMPDIDIPADLDALDVAGDSDA